VEGGGNTRQHVVIGVEGSSKIQRLCLGQQGCIHILRRRSELPEEISKKTFCIGNIAVVKTTVSIKVSYTLIQASVSIAHEGRVEHFSKVIQDPPLSLCCGRSQIHFVVEVEDTTAKFEGVDIFVSADEQEYEYNEEVYDRDAHLPS